MDEEKPPDEIGSTRDTNFGENTEFGRVWPGTEEVPTKPSWAQIISGQVADDEVKKFEEAFELMVQGEGAIAKINGSDYVLRERYLKDLSRIVKGNDEGKAKMEIIKTEKNEKIIQNLLSN